MRRVLIGLALLFALLFLVLPLAVVFAGAFAKGWGAFAAALAVPDTRHALFLTLLVTAVTVPVNVVFGLAFAWLVTRFRFRGRAFIVVQRECPARRMVCRARLAVDVCRAGDCAGDGVCDLSVCGA